ncbi:hypothetical protein Belba_1301 [Belliella baltica DSM 15883]|uniref:Uncharacterized protein n=1 Tax=Belliella baltica (strain DSM 15883 / CIP 108006 / LMG 21964 / BA134) TaxID=866536 RepID=I3Z3W0_BELBD|nr:hypothetical protein [Belliella baltica]AFL83928.1 hypothetical protein Belba_1301 [Belliella baltica DSM 15883]
MRYPSKFKASFFVLLLLVASFSAYSQDEKYRARVSLEHVKVMNGEAYIDISAKYKGEDGFETATDLEFNVYRLMNEDSLMYLGQARTNDAGRAKFFLKDTMKHSDTTGIYTYTVAIEDNDRFRDTDQSISFSEAGLSVDITMVDSVYYMSAILTDAAGNPLQGEFLKVGLIRLYGSLPIGEDNYETDENGSILVPIEERMPGLGGELTFEVVLKESEAYGTIRAAISAPIGIPIVDESTFDERTMWSPRVKTPYYLLIFPNLIIFGVWIPIVFLIFNLYRILKSKTNQL